MKRELSKQLARLTAPSASLEPPVIGGPIDPPLSPAAQKSLKGPAYLGLGVVVVFVFGFTAWAAVTPIWGAVSAPGVVKVESNRKIVKSRDGGVVRQVNIHEGDQVRAGQILIKIDDTVPRAQIEIYENQYYAALMQASRLRAEVNRSAMYIPYELSSRKSDQKILNIIQNEQTVYDVRKAAIDSQAAILNQRLQQLESARSGLLIQADSIDRQIDLMRQEMQGYQTLLEKGFAPKSLILRMQRQLADTEGKRGALATDINRNGQQSGETRMQLATLYEQRSADSASALRDTEARLADLGPRLTAAREALSQTEIRAPADGYVLGLTQNTIGGVAGAGETLMDIVPSHIPLVVSVQVRPSDIDEVRPGMPAQIILQAYNSYRVPHINAEVATVSADAISDQEKKSSFYRVELKIPPIELKKLPKGAHLYPGMPATALIKTQKRTILSFLIGPMGQLMERSLREQ